MNDGGLMNRWSRGRSWIAILSTTAIAFFVFEIGGPSVAPQMMSYAAADEGDASQKASAGVYVTGRIGNNPCKLDAQGELLWCYHGDAMQAGDGGTKAEYLAVDATGSVYTASPISRRLCKLDEGGELNWCTEMNYHPTAVAADVDGGVFVGTLARGRHTDQPLLCRFDDAGQEDWCISMGEREIEDVAVDAGGQVYVSTSSGESAKGGLCKYGRDGSEVWCYHRHRHSSGAARIRALAVNPAGAILTVGGDGKACKWDEVGQRVWCVEGDSRPVDVAVTADGRSHIAFNDEVCAFDADGKELWCYEADSPRVYEIEVDPEGNVYSTWIGNNLCKVDNSGEERWCTEPLDFLPQKELKLATAPGPSGTFPTAWGQEHPSSQQYDFSFAEAASSEDESPWMTLPAPAKWRLGIPDRVEQFKEIGRCYAHPSGLRVCLLPREPGSSRYESYVLFGDEENLFLIGCAGSSQVGGIQRCGLRDRARLGRDIPIEVSNFDRQARSKRADGSQRRLPRTSSPGFEMWSDLSLRGKTSRETGEAAGGAALVRLNCGAEIDFVPISSSDSEELIENAKLRWPLPKTSFSGGMTDEGRVVATVGQRVAGGGGELSLYVGKPPELEEIPIEGQSVYLDGGSRLYRFADGGSLFLPNPMYDPFRGERPDNTGTLRMAEGEPEQSVNRLSNQELREIFEEEIREPSLEIPEQRDSPPGACTLLRRAIDSP